MTKEKTLLNPIEEFIKNNTEQEPTFQTLFEIDDKENVDLKTDLSTQEIVLINKIKMNDLFIKNNLGYSPYSEFLISYMRLKVSKDRKSREEFVDINRKERFEKDLKKFGDFSNLMKVKE